MNTHPRFLAATVAALLCIGLVACGKPSTPVATAPASAPATNVSDVDVTEHVKTAMLQTESLKNASITVVTSKGDVRLSGVLDNQAQIDDALRIARAAEGAHTIHDELTIRK